jgi:hypothetical protein
MQEFIYDALNSFGSLTAAGDFPNIISLEDAKVDRMTVDLKTPDGAIVSAAGVTLTIKGSATETGTYTAITTGAAALPTDVEKGYGLPIPQNEYKFLKASVAGTFTGTVEAIINSYIGK